jgi:hypothetical protein
VSYPADWYRRSEKPSKDRLDLLDSKDGGQEGVVVAPGHANIVVSESPESSGATFEKVIAEYSKYSVSIELTKVSVEDGSDCNRMAKLIKKFTDGPEDYVRARHIPYQIATDFFCEVRGRGTVVVNLLYWEHDKRAGTYNEVAARMAKSIRLLP